MAALSGCDRAMFGRLNGEAVKAQELTLRVEGTDYEAVKELQAAALDGNPYAALQIGYIYHSGAGGIAPNYRIAREYYLKAAESVSLAQYNLGLMDYYALGAPQNLASAVKRFQAVSNAKQGGENFALLLLGAIFSEGNGMAPNLALAASYYEKAATGNDVEAAYRLGRMIRLGQGRPKNYEQAIQWLTRSADNGNAKAMFELAQIYANQDSYYFNINQTTQWLLIASQYDEAYKEVASKYMEKLSGPEQKMVIHKSRHWLGIHPKQFESPDLKKPLNKVS